MQVSVTYAVWYSHLRFEHAGANDTDPGFFLPLSLAAFFAGLFAGALRQLLGFSTCVVLAKHITCYHNQPVLHLNAGRQDMPMSAGVWWQTLENATWQRTAYFVLWKRIHKNKRLHKTQIYIVRHHCRSWKQPEVAAEAVVQ